nr:unnamed protein product [Callosobruchus analis]
MGRWILEIQEYDFEILHRPLSMAYIDVLKVVFRPKICKWQILRFNHGDIGHFAYDNTFEHMSSKSWFPEMRRFIRYMLEPASTACTRKPRLEENLDNRKRGKCFYSRNRNTRYFCQRCQKWLCLQRFDKNMLPKCSIQ